MMNVVDSSGWVEYLIDGPNADLFELPILDSEHLITPTICIYEVCNRVLVQFGEERALNTIGSMFAGMVVDLDQEIAMSAAILSVESKLAMADSIILATARAYGATLWTQDVHFEGIEGVRYVEKKAG